MSVFGGSSQLGSASFGGDPFGTDPLYICEYIVRALEPFQRNATGGSVGTIAVMTSAPDNLEALSQQLQGGLPAILVGYTGGTYQPVAASGDAFDQRFGVSIVCIADSLRSRKERLSGRNVYSPGLWNLTRWAAFYGCRALSEIAGVRHAQPVSEQFTSYGSEFFAGIVELQATQTIDIYDDAVSLRLERVGIVHSPSDTAQLFDVDNTTPNTDDPTGAGVFTL